MNRASVVANPRRRPGTDLAIAIARWTIFGCRDFLRARIIIHVASAPPRPRPASGRAFGFRRTHRTVSSDPRRTAFRAFRTASLWATDWRRPATSDPIRSMRVWMASTVLGSDFRNRFPGISCSTLIVVLLFSGGTSPYTCDPQSRVALCGLERLRRAYLAHEQEDRPRRPRRIQVHLHHPRRVAQARRPGGALRRPLAHRHP